MSSSSAAAVSGLAATLIARQPLLLGTVGLTQEDVGQHARPKSPVRTDGGSDRLWTSRVVIDDPSAYATEQQTIHTLGEASRERDRRAAARRPAEQHDLLQGELVEHGAQHRNVSVERQIVVEHLAV